MCIMFGALIVLAALLIHWKPRVQLETEEGFTVAAVNPTLVPACIARSEAAQRLLARVATMPAGGENTDADELRLLVSKVCCMEADISSPAAGVIRTLSLQFRTSHDMDVASTIVGNCRAAVLQNRDLELIQDKISTRGHELIGRLIGSKDAHDDFDAVLKRLQWAMTSFCKVPAPNMQTPPGPRDAAYWESNDTADLSQYQGVSALPK